MEDVKQCVICSETKNIEQFFIRKESKSKKRRNECISCLRLRSADYYKNNIDKVKTKHKQYKLANKEKLQKAHSSYRKNKRHADPFHKTIHNLRALISGAFKKKGYKKKTKTALLLGADFETVQLHLWCTAYNNYGLGMFDTSIKWNIDHIIPIASAKTEEQLIKLQHYTNLQYLTQEDNLRKSDKY